MMPLFCSFASINLQLQMQLCEVLERRGKSKLYCDCILRWAVNAVPLWIRACCQWIYWVKTGPNQSGVIVISATTIMKDYQYITEATGWMQDIMEQAWASCMQVQVRTVSYIIILLYVPVFVWCLYGAMFCTLYSMRQITASTPALKQLMWGLLTPNHEQNSDSRIFPLLCCWALGLHVYAIKTIMKFWGSSLS